jgi:threonine dehydrogenase-like Zn-dependent dehydrogenase
MRGVWLENGVISLRDDIPEPVPALHEVVLAVRCAGICGTDLELCRGYAGFVGVPGHEVLGTVMSPGAFFGRRVVAEITVACGVCRECLAGRRGHCLQRRVLGVRERSGAFAECIAVPEANLHVVPDEVCDDDAVLTEPLAAALEVLEQVNVDPGTLVAVLGDGRLGQLVARVLALTGCRLRVIGRHPAKLALLRGLGIPTLGPDVEPLGADVVVECTGSSDGLADARRHVRPRGTVVLKSTVAGTVNVDLAGLVVDEITVVGSRCGPFGKALGLLASGRLDLTGLVTARYPLGQAREAFVRAADGDALKVLLDIGA